MDFLRKAVPFLAGPVVGGLSLLGGKQQEEEQARQQQMGQDRVKLMHEGLARGRELGERIFGQSQKTTGTDVQDVIRRRRERLNDPSFAADTLRRTGQQEKRYASQKGASDAQKRNISYQAALAAGQQEDLDYNRRLEDFQSLVGNIAGMQSSLELGGGQLGLASQYIAPPQQASGALNKLLTGLGL